MSIFKWIAWRFMMKATEKGKFSLMTLFAWLAIGLGIGAMSSLLSIMYGFESVLRDRVLTAYPHVMVKPTDSSLKIADFKPWTERLYKVPRVKRAVPYLEGEMIVESEKRVVGAVLWGLDDKDFPGMEGQVSEGRAPQRNAVPPQVMLGSELAYRLGVHVGSQVRIVSPTARGGVMGAVPQSETFQVSGIYSSGHYAFDEQYLFLEMLDAQDLLKVGAKISGWNVWSDSIDHGEKLAPEIQKILPAGYEAQGWNVFNAALFGSLKLEQYSMFTILSFAIVIAVMNIVITLTMQVHHKKKNVGILRALGASQSGIRRIFVWQGFFLGVVGLVLGGVLTFSFVIYIRHFSTFQLSAIYYDRSIPIEVRPMSLVVIYAVAILLIFLATWLPSARAARLDPIEAIRE